MIKPNDIASILRGESTEHENKMNIQKGQTAELFKTNIISSTGFSDFERDLENEILSCQMDDLALTQNTHLSQYTQHLD